MKFSAVPDWAAFSAAAEPAKLADVSVRERELEAEAARVEQIAALHLAAVWRTTRELGVLACDLEDVVQEVMLVCVRRLRDIEPGRERSFLLATAARVASNWRRGRRRRPVEPLDANDEAMSLALDPQTAATNPARALEQKRELALVQAALDQMSEPQRVAFILFELEELTAREIAEQLGSSESVIFARVQRARAVFRRYVATVRGRESG